VPLMPVITIGDVAAAAVLAAVRVSVVPVALEVGLKLATTPLGRPLALNVTLPVKPPLGVTVSFIGLQDIHPPVKVAPEYEKVVAAIHQKQAKILAAQADSIRTNALARAHAYSVTNSAEAERINLELTALARAAAFTNQLPAFNAAPSVYLQRAYYQTFPRAVGQTRKYVMLATNTQDVISYDLQQKFDAEYFKNISTAVPLPKK